MATTAQITAKRVTPVPKELAHQTHLFGAINGRKFNLSGSGIGQPHDGRLNTHLISTSGPVHFPMHILSPIAIMGYPTYSNYQKGGYDLFKVSDGYSYSRTLSFDCGGHMETEHNIVRTPEGLCGEFEVVSANLDSPEITDIEPCVETFVPAGPGKIHSFFKVRWLAADGGVYSADVKSEYRLTHKMELPFPHFRLVQFSTNHSDTELRQDETLIVLNNFQRLTEAIQ
jgi:hypothetical protein